MVKKNMRAQAAMEYLMTYGWALLVIVVVIAILLAINPFQTPQGCKFGLIGFICNNPVLDTDGKLFMSITNANNNAIKIYGAKCTADKSPNAPSHLYAGSSSFVMLQRQEEYEVSSATVECTKNGDVVKLAPGSDFSGKVWLFYQNEEDGSTYPVRSVSADFSTKVVQASGGSTPLPDMCNGVVLAAGNECCSLTGSSDWQCPSGHCNTTNASQCTP